MTPSGLSVPSGAEGSPQRGSDGLLEAFRAERDRRRTVYHLAWVTASRREVILVRAHRSGARTHAMAMREGYRILACGSLVPQRGEECPGLARMVDCPGCRVRLGLDQ